MGKGTPYLKTGVSRHGVGNFYEEGEGKNLAPRGQPVHPFYLYPLPLTPLLQEVYYLAY